MMVVLQAENILFPLSKRRWTLSTEIEGERYPSFWLGGSFCFDRDICTFIPINTLDHWRKEIQTGVVKTHTHTHTDKLNLPVQPSMCQTQRNRASSHLLRDTLRGPSITAASGWLLALWKLLADRLTPSFLTNIRLAIRPQDDFFFQP